MLAFLTVCKCYHFFVIIFACTAWVLSFMLSFNVITFCYHFPPFFFFLKTWHTPLCDRDRKGKEVIFRLAEPSLLNDLRKQKNTINYTVDVKIAQRREFNVVFFQGILQETSRILHTSSAGRLRFGLIEERTRGRIYSK